MSEDRPAPTIRELFDQLVEKVKLHGPLTADESYTSEDAVALVEVLSILRGVVDGPTFDELLDRARSVLAKSIERDRRIKPREALAFASALVRLESLVTGPREDSP